MKEDPGMRREVSLSQGVCYITDPLSYFKQIGAVSIARNRRLSSSVCDPLRRSSKPFPTTQPTWQIRSALPPCCLLPVTRHTHS
ncbi:hypothetical protein ElyMa_004827000 [Elysia marginata]|uniref:Uncharacterized protein n=1 Tax=Elysia marginata TaxID=1093978 RepID=A0AAV4IET7_9GAST|nr:hypothetical protein ElyMa_004827000 [Elysia marginata]